MTYAEVLVSDMIEQGIMFREVSDMAFIKENIFKQLNLTAELVLSSGVVGYNFILDGKLYKIIAFTYKCTPAFRIIPIEE